MSMDRSSGSCLQLFQYQTDSTHFTFLCSRKATERAAR